MSAKSYVTLVVEVTAVDERTAIYRAGEIDSAIATLLRGGDAEILSSGFHPSLSRCVQVVTEDIARHAQVTS